MSEENSGTKLCCQASCGALKPLVGLTLDAEAKILSCQKWMLWKMLYIKWRPNCDGNGLEPWLDFHERSLRAAGNIMNDLMICAVQSLEDNKRKWIGHIVRMGSEEKPPHLLKAILLWRPREWWEYQVLFNDNPFFLDCTIKHPAELGRPLRFEEQFVGRAVDWINY